MRQADREFFLFGTACDWTPANLSIQPYLRRTRYRRKTALPSPQPNDVEAIEHPVCRDNGELSCQSLCGEHPVERVAMGTGQAPGTFGIGDADGHFLESLPTDVAWNIERNGFAPRQFADPKLGNVVKSSRQEGPWDAVGLSTSVYGGVGGSHQGDRNRWPSLLPQEWSPVEVADVPVRVRQFGYECGCR